VVTEASGKDSGTDTVISTAATYTLGAYVENLTLDGTADISGTGNALNNILTGNSGDNTLNGGSGKDQMIGNGGDDTYVVNDAGDTITEGGAGIDTVQSSIAFSLAGTAIIGGDVENLTLTGTAAISGTGNALANIITGNSGANTLTGNGDDDTLDGSGGNDTVIGGVGDDQINVATGHDVVRYTTALDGHDVITNFDGNASGGQDVLNLDALFDSLAVATADRAGRVTVGPLVGNSVDVQVDGVAIATLNLANPADAITVGADVVVGTL
jgi:Ca2+-binding RTX toxin-like protein